MFETLYDVTSQEIELRIYPAYLLQQESIILIIGVYNPILDWMLETQVAALLNCFYFH